MTRLDKAGIIVSKCNEEFDYLKNRTKTDRDYLVLHFDGSQTDRRKHTKDEAETIQCEEKRKTGELLVLWPVLSTDLEVAGNARLIAAAPELLTACKKAADFAQEIMNVLVGYQMDNFNSSVNSARGYAMSILDILWPAISAAEKEGQNEHLPARRNRKDF